MSSLAAKNAVTSSAAFFVNRNAFLEWMLALGYRKAVK
jgi:hypothetical protein